MVTIKSYTDIEQSKKLAEILPLESADMCWTPFDEKWDAYLGAPNTDAIKKEIPCWSLTALLGVLPDYTLQSSTDRKVFIVCDSKKPIIYAYDNPVDACVAMIEKLNELKML